MTEAVAEVKGRKLRTHAILTATVLIALLVALGLSWQLYLYQGPVAALAEWQFRYLGRLYPLATIIVVTSLVVLPLILLLAVRSRRKRLGALLTQEPHAVMKRARSATRDLLFAAAAMAVCAAVLLAHAASIGRDGKTHVLRPGLALPQLETGDRVKVEGHLRLDRIALYRSNAPFFARAMAVAPLEEPSGNVVGILAEVRRDRPTISVTTTVDGFVAPSGSSGPIVPLYKNAGMPIADKPILLARSLDALRAPFQQAALFLVLLSALVLVAALVERSWFRTLDRQFALPEVKVS